MNLSSASGAPIVVTIDGKDYRFAILTINDMAQIGEVIYNNDIKKWEEDKTKPKPERPGLFDIQKILVFNPAGIMMCLFGSIKKLHPEVEYEFIINLGYSSELIDLSAKLCGVELKKDPLLETPTETSETPK